jgi:hypothetical protein
LRDAYEKGKTVHIGSSANTPSLKSVWNSSAVKPEGTEAPGEIPAVAKVTVYGVRRSALTPPKAR